MFFVLYRFLFNANIRESQCIVMQQIKIRYIMITTIQVYPILVFLDKILLYSRYAKARCARRETVFMLNQSELGEL